MRTVTVLIPVLLLAATDMMGDCVAPLSFAPPVHYASSARQVVRARDLDGDGLPELIASGNQTDQLSALSLFANRGDGTFMPERLLPSMLGAKLEAIGDLNGDGLPELIVSNYFLNGIAVYIERAALQFDGPFSYDTATHGGPSLIVDYDHDGIPDVISFSFGSGNLVRAHFFRGTGDGTLLPKTTIDTMLPNAGSPSIRTIDGALEILVSEHFGRLAILRYQNATLSISEHLAGPGVDRSSIFVDLNHDGIADIVDISDDGGAFEPVFVTLANADDTFQARKQITHNRTLSFPVDVRAADLDGDGRIDVIVSDFQLNHLNVYRGNGEGELLEALPVDAGGPVNTFDVADVNHDGYPDLITANNDHTLSVIMNRGPCRPPRRRASRSVDAQGEAAVGRKADVQKRGSGRGE